MTAMQRSMFGFRKATRPIAGVDHEALVREAALLLPSPARRRFLTGFVGLGSLTLLTGCDITDGVSAEAVLRHISRFNDEIQAMLFNPHRLAPAFAGTEITRPFPFNAYYPEDEAPEIVESEWRLQVGGRVSDKRALTLGEIAAMPRETQITKHICIEGWSAVGKFEGVPLRALLEKVGADTSARYVEFRCADDYSTSLDMASALHAQTQLTLRLNDETLPRRNGYPMKVRVPTKLGFKNPKHITDLIVTNDYRDGFWEAYGYNWFSGT